MSTPKTKNPDQAALEVAALQQTLATQGWAIIVSEIDKNIGLLKSHIVDKVGPTGGRLSDAQCDELRVKVGYLTEIREMPARLIEHLQREDDRSEEFDPYETVKEKS